jgi:hypothetical protein
MSPVVLVVLVLVLAGVGAYFGHLAEQKRREEMRAVAARLQCSFQADGDGRWARDEHFDAFSRGHSQRAYNTLSGRLEVGTSSYAVRGGDFLYKVTSGSGKNRSTRTYRFSYWVVHLAWPHCPTLRMRTENVLDKVAGALGFDDIDFESEEFSRRFHVTSSDKKFAYDLIDPRMMEFLLPRLTTALELEHGKLLLTSGGNTWAPGEFARKLTFAGEFLARWPEHLVARLDGATHA